MFRFIILILTLTISNSYADVGYNDGSRKGDSIIPPRIYITNNITSADVDKLKKLIVQADLNGRELGLKLAGNKYALIQLILDSGGGNLFAAISMGALIREYGLIARVEKGSVCAGSCVFLLAAAPRRDVEGRVGLHRPYRSTNEGLTVDSQKQDYERIEKLAKGYLAMMNVPESLYDRMFRIPPEKIVWLTSAELQQYGLNENDPYLHEATTTKIATYLGVSKKDYIEALQEADRSCNENNYSRCLFAIVDKKRTNR